MLREEPEWPGATSQVRPGATTSKPPAAPLDLFTDDAITQIHQAARGKPRTVNNIAVAALIATAAAGKNLVDHPAARAAIAEITATD